MQSLKHSLKAEMEAVLALIRAASPLISEGIKWNAPSFCVNEYFATINVRSNDAVQIVLHLGAKTRDDITDRLAINDPKALLQWLSKDRASVKFHDMKEIHANGVAFQEIIRLWITFLGKE
jgi:hypothetical protein